jgi:hypothetical protein
LNDHVWPFLEVEIAMIVNESPSNHASGADGFNNMFFKMAWEIIKGNVVNFFNALWVLDSLKVFLLNDAVIVLNARHRAPLDSRTIDQSF